MGVERLEIIVEIFPLLYVSLEDLQWHDGKDRPYVFPHGYFQVVTLIGRRRGNIMDDFLEDGLQVGRVSRA